MNEQTNEVLKESVSDAQMLLRYASSKGIELPAELVKTIVDSEKLTCPGAPCTPEGKDAFWIAFSTLAKAVQPATTESLRYEEPTEPSWLAKRWAQWTGTAVQAGLSAVETAVDHARNWALFGLAVVVIFQAFFEVGNATLTEYLAAQRSVSERAANIRSLDQQIAAATQAKQPEPDVAALRRARSTADIEREQAVNATDRRLYLMQFIMRWIDWDKFLKKYDNPYERAQSVLAVLQGYLLVIREFFLPMAWAFLGAALYVSRALAEDIRTSAYAPHRKILYRTRYFMGTVAGFVVAKLFPTTLGVSQETIAPLALALIAGYSVEVLFSLLEKIIGTFSSAK